ncbi:MAG: rRNA maturation RNase YbeY [Mycoplasmataceae bacterium]|nr:rRNA maturation RNase YbeY [Mycoplasmataceae bacterium]
MINLQLINRYKGSIKTPRCFKKKLKKITALACDNHNVVGDIELSLIIVNDHEMKELSKKYKKINKTTDVLSFPADFMEMRKTIGYFLLGDIYISAPKVRENAKEFNHSELREWSYLFTHGILHLLGHDHKLKDKEKIMNDEADKIMSIIKVKR